MNKKSPGESEKSRPKKGFFETFRTLPETFFQTFYAAPIGAVVCPEIRAFTEFWGEISSIISKLLSDHKGAVQTQKWPLIAVNGR